MRGDARQFGELDAGQVGAPGGTAPAPAAAAAVCGPDMLAAGMAWLTGQLQAHAAQPITYQRGADSVSLCATFGRTKLMLANEFGTVRIEWTDRDFILPAAALVLAGQVVKPRRDEVVTVDDGVELSTFQVLPYADEPHWKWCDPYRQMIRIHTQRVFTEPSA